MSETPEAAEAKDPKATEAPAEATETPEAGEESQRVPLDRFRSVTSENKELRGELEDLKKWKEEQEAAQLSEIDRERAAREKAEALAQEATEKAVNLERGGWLKSAALAAGFADPEDAVALIGTGEIEDTDAAAQAVKDLADKKPHLLQESSKGPAPLGSPTAGSAPSVNPDDPKAALGADLLGYLRNR
jgi:hypothetical protein